jgi:hypothetical protein
MSRESRPHVLIVGSREYPNLAEVREYVRALNLNTIVVSGGAPGVDRTAAEEGKKQGLAVLELSAPWGYDDRGAGPLRNSWLIELLPEGSRVCAFWDGRSHGTRGLIDLAKTRGIFVLEIRRSADAPGNPWTE